MIKSFDFLRLTAEDWLKILTIDIDITSRYKNREPKLRLVKNAAKELIFYKPNIPGQKETVDFLFVKSLIRKDYDRLFNAISSSCEKTKTCVNIKPVRTRFFRFSSLFFLLLAFFSVGLKPSIRQRPRLEQAYLIIRSARIMEIVSKFSRYNYKHLVVFADMQPVDHALVMLARLQSIPTITLQHGLYVNYSRRPNINEVNYLMHNADHFLAWGNNTSQLITDYHPKANITICGKPIQKLERSTRKRVIAVIFDQNLYYQQNLDMLRIVYDFAQENNYKVLPRKHPNNKAWRYREYLESELRETDIDITSVELAVGHTSTFLYELMAMGIPVMRFATDAPALYTDPDLEFYDQESFKSQFKDIQNRNFDFEREGHNYLSHMGDDSKSKYSQFFNDMAVSKPSFKS